MIGKIAPKGKGFRGLAAYLLRGGRGHIVGGPMAGRTPRELAREFGELRRLNPKLTKAVAHLMLSPSPDDPPLNDEQWQALATRYVEGMGFGNSPWVAVVHADTDHQHLHVVACRVDFDGKTVSDANDFRKSEKVVRQLERDFGLCQLPGAGASRQRNGDHTNQGDPPMKNTNPSAGNEERNLPAATVRRTADDIHSRDDAPEANHSSGASTAETLSDKERRAIRRQVLDPAFKRRMELLFGDQLTRIHQHAHGATLYFRHQQRIFDYGDRLSVSPDMGDSLAAERLVALARERNWRSIQFSGSDAFVEAAMREALHEHLPVVPQGASQSALWARIQAEQHGGMASASGPATLPHGATEAEVDLYSTLAELDALEDMPLVFSDAPAPTLSPIRRPPQFLDLRQRLQERREKGRDSESSKPNDAPARRPRTRPGLSG